MAVLIIIEDYSALCFAYDQIMLGTKCIYALFAGHDKGYQNAFELASI
jgi:hypothetical protein